MKQPEDVLKNTSPNYLFQMTGKFGAKEALFSLNRAARCFLLALQDMDGKVADQQEDYALWGMSCRLPGAKSFTLLLEIMAKCGWVTRVKVADAKCVLLTPLGTQKCAEFRAKLKPESNDT